MAALGVIVAVGCQGEPRSLSWIVVFEDSSLESRAVFIEANITPGDCTGVGGAAPVYEADGAFPGTLPAPRRLSPGDYAFSVRVRDTSCRWFASGCRAETLPLGETDETIVVLFQTPEQDACPGACLSGQCLSDPDGGVRDVGITDTGVADTGPSDTGSADTGSPDTGSPPECLADGECGSPSYRRTGSWSCRADGALDRASFEFLFPECNDGRCGTRIETRVVECRCRDNICSSSGCADVVDSSSRCDDGSSEGPCPIPSVLDECHR